MNLMKKILDEKDSVLILQSFRSVVKKSRNDK